jgi:hypothetical protein
MLIRGHEKVPAGFGRQGLGAEKMTDGKGGLGGPSRVCALLVFTSVRKRKTTRGPPFNKRLVDFLNHPALCPLGEKSAFS